VTPNLDHWLAEPVIRLHHRREARAAPERLWEEAQAVTLADSHLLGRVVRWRIPGTPGDITYRELFSSPPFTLLDEGDTHSVSGICGRIWNRKREFARLDGPDAFTACRVPGTARVVFAHWVEPDGDGSALASEVRVEPADRQARVGLRLVRPLIVAFEHLISAEALAAATRRAERD
jgi:hypothetical protein